MVRIIALLTLLATTGCVYPYGTPYGGYPYGGYPYGYSAQTPAYAPAYEGQAYAPGYGGTGYAPAAGDYNPVSGTRTGSE
jgi:hypothetical protein